VSGNDGEEGQSVALADWALAQNSSTVMPAPQARQSAVMAMQQKRFGGGFSGLEISECTSPIIAEFSDAALNPSSAGCGVSDLLTFSMFQVAAGLRVATCRKLQSLTTWLPFLKVPLLEHVPDAALSWSHAVPSKAATTASTAAVVGSHRRTHMAVVIGAGKANA